MPQFQYVAQTAEGAIERGTLSCLAAEDVRKTLQMRDLRLVSVQEIGSSRLKFSFRSLMDDRRLRSIRSRDLELVLQQLAVMLESGLELASSLQELGAHSPKGTVKKLCLEVAASIAQGNSFSKALTDTKAFPYFITQLMSVGEESGELSLMLRRSAEFMEKRREAVGGLVAALAYPLVVAIAALTVSGYLVGWAIPKLATFPYAMGRTLPPMTQSLVDFSDAVRSYGAPTAAVAGGLLCEMVLITRWPAGRIRFDKEMLRLPLIGRIMRMAETQLFASSLALMLRSGVLLQDALRTAACLHRNSYLAQQINASNAQISRGSALATSLTGFEPLLASMIAVGERTGELPRALEHVAALYASQLASQVKQISRMVEPAIIVFVGGVVGYVYVAFFMALMSAGGNFK